MNRIALAWVALAVVVLAALYGWVRPQSPPEPVAAGPVPVPAAPSAREFDFEIAQGRVTGPPLLSVIQGERVTLRVRSDAADELHVHGYDLAAPLPAGETVALSFVAGVAGRFEVELHAARRGIGALEVQPRP